VTKRDKFFVVGMLVLLLILCVKSLWIDNYTPKNDSEEAFYNKVENIIDERYTGWLYDYHLVTPKIVKVSEMSDTEKKYKDLEGNIQTTEGVYKAKIRKYILWILPFSEERILEGIEK